MTKRPNFYHVCFAVPDLKEAMAELSELFGYSWSTPMSSKLGIWDYQLVFSREQPHIELVASVEGSPWFAETPRFHHLGFWSDDLDTDIKRWIENGAGMTFDAREMKRHFAYLEAPKSGMPFEGVSIRQKQMFEELWINTTRPDANASDNDESPDNSV